MRSVVRDAIVAGSARGAVLVHVAVAIIGLLAFSALTIDYGVMWMSRRQAQNAADAAALAGALSLAFDNGTDFDRARLSGQERSARPTRYSARRPNITQGTGSGGSSDRRHQLHDCPRRRHRCPPGYVASR